MKTYKLLVVYGLVFTILMGGILILKTRANTIQAVVQIRPWSISLEDMGPEQFTMKIALPNGNNHEDIDPESIRIEGFDVTKDDPDYPKVKKKYFKFLADGSKMMDWVINGGIWHMAPGPGEFVYLDLTLTGEVGGQEFAGTFTLRVIAEQNDNNNGVAPPPG